MHFTLADLVADITQNGAESGAELVELEIRGTGKEFRFAAKDNGKGMDKASLERALDPFVTDGVKHPGRKVGLGIPFLIQTANQSGGGWDIASETIESAGTGMTPDGRFAGGAKHGTSVEAWFDLDNVDTPPAGDIPGLFRTVILFTGPKEIIIRRSRTGVAGLRDLVYTVKKSELTDALGDLEEAASLVLLTKYLKSFEEDE